MQVTAGHEFDQASEAHGNDLPLRVRDDLARRLVEGMAAAGRPREGNEAVRQGDEDEWHKNGSDYLGRKIVRSILNENGYAVGFAEGSIVGWLPFHVRTALMHAPLL